MEVIGIVVRKLEWSDGRVNIVNEMRSEDNNLGKFWLRGEERVIVEG